CFGLIYLFFSLLPKETAPYDDRSYLSLRVTAPEGVSYDYMDRFMTDLTMLINDSVPEKTVSLEITSPSFGSSSVNSGIVRLGLVQPSERDRSQKEIANHLSRLTRQSSERRVTASAQPTIAVSRPGGLPIQHINQPPAFAKLAGKVPGFMQPLSLESAFSVVDVNLKSNNPEGYVTIDRA